MDHKWHLVIVKGNDAPGDSLDSIYWCERCGCVRHDYAHGGGMKSPSYPRYFAPDRSGHDEPECHPVRLVEDMEDQPEGFPASAGFAPRLALGRERSAYLAGATAYAAAMGHSGLLSANKTLRKVRDEWKPFVPDAGYQPEQLEK